MRNTEKNIQAEIQIALCQNGCIVHREQSGLFWSGILTDFNGQYVLTKLRRITVGFEGKSDLQGHRISDGKCFYIEVKRLTGVKAEAQKRFIKAMQNSGALAGFAKNVKEALQIIGVK